MARIYATLVGTVLFLLGLVGLLLGDELLLGVVNIDVLEDVVHVASGPCCSTRGFNATRRSPAA